jgi:hypothetical protein
MKRLVFTFILASATGLLAQKENVWNQTPHQQDEKEWAAKTGLSPFTVHQLWRLASHFADTADDDSRIELLDVSGLGHNQTLLVTSSGSEHCLSITVFEKARSYVKIWAEDQAPDEKALCQDGTHVSAGNGKILVSMPSKGDSAEGGRTEYTQYEYEWTGKTYRFTGTRKMYGPVPPKPNPNACPPA